VNRREARRIEAVERELAAAATRVWTLSEADARGLEELGAAQTRAFALAPAADAAERAGPGTGADGPGRAGPGTAEDERGRAGPGTGEDGAGYDVGLLGTWTWAANAAGLRWFLDEVRGRLPESVRVGVAGAGAPGDLRGAVGLGVVPDAGAFLRGSRVVAIPSVAGSGVQVKTLDAIAAGVPVVATSVALRGIPDPPPTVRVADDPREFAAAVSEVLARPDGAGSAAAQAARDWTEARRERFRADVAAAVEELA
jgi:hypothetical protein